MLAAFTWHAACGLVHVSTQISGSLVLTVREHLSIWAGAEGTHLTWVLLGWNQGVLAWLLPGAPGESPISPFSSVWRRRHVPWPVALPAAPQLAASAESSSSCCSGSLAPPAPTSQGICARST